MSRNPNLHLIFQEECRHHRRRNPILHLISQRTNLADVVGWLVGWFVGCKKHTQPHTHTQTNTHHTHTSLHFTSLHFNHMILKIYQNVHLWKTFNDLQKKCFFNRFFTINFGTRIGRIGRNNMVKKLESLAKVVVTLVATPNYW